MDEEPEPLSLEDVGVSLGDLYDALPEHIEKVEPPYDVEAGLARFDAWIDAHPDAKRD